jgi:predicted enzyme related to lactoylglutathione lyase
VTAGRIDNPDDSKKERTMPRPIHFEIPADDPERAIAFYGKVFGWQCQKWEGPIPYWLVQTGSNGAGINGGIHPRAFPGQGPVNTIDVPSCDAAVKQVESAGGKVALPKMAVPGIGWLAYCTDPEGNTFGVLEPDEQAK